MPCNALDKRYKRYSNDNPKITQLAKADVETINLESNDTSPTPNSAIQHRLALQADKATAINIKGDAQLALTLNGSNAVEKINASANTGGVDVNLTAAEGITFTGSAAADTITLGELDSVSSGKGKDTFIITAPSVGNRYSSIADFNAKEDTLQFADKGDEVFQARIAKLASTATFQAGKDAVIKLTGLVDLSGTTIDDFAFA